VIAKDGLEALKALEHDGIGCVFLDLVMPIMDGLEFLKEARDRKILKCPVVVVTAHHEFKTDHFPEVVKVLCKPVHAEDLLGRLGSGGSS